MNEIMTVGSDDGKHKRVTVRSCAENGKILNTFDWFTKIWESLRLRDVNRWLLSCEFNPLITRLKLAKQNILRRDVFRCAQTDMKYEIFVVQLFWFKKSGSVWFLVCSVCVCAQRWRIVITLFSIMYDYIIRDKTGDYHENTKIKNKKIFFPVTLSEFSICVEV